MKKEMAEPVLKSQDIDYILHSIQDTVNIIEYPSVAIFSAVTRCSLINFLKGTGCPDISIETSSVYLFRQLADYAHENVQHKWFAEWSKKLPNFVKEKHTNN